MELLADERDVLELLHDAHDDLKCNTHCSFMASQNVLRLFQKTLHNIIGVCSVAPPNLSVR